MVELIKTRRLDVMCPQEPICGGNKASDLADGCKLFYNEGKKARNGVGVSVRIHQDNVLEVCRSEGDDGEASVVYRAMYGPLIAHTCVGRDEDKYVAVVEVER